MTEANKNAQSREPDLTIELSCVPRVNFALAQNDGAMIHNITIRNTGPSDILGAVLAISSSPSVVISVDIPVDRIVAGGTLALTDLDVSLDPVQLSALNEAETGTVQAQLTYDGDSVAVAKAEVEFLARDEWGGLEDMAQILAAFVAPNDPVVAPLLKEASRLLERSGQSGAIEGYQSDDPARVWQIAGAIWSAATGLGLTYAMPPSSFEVEGQKIRSPGRIITEGLATCLDSTLFLAAAYEAAGLNTSVLFSQGHAWLGVWLRETDFGHVTEPDVIAVRKAAQAKDFIPIETTYLTRRPVTGFEEAVEEGRARLSEAREAEFLLAVDVARARAARIRPLASPDDADPATEEVDDTVEPAALPQPLDLGVLPGELRDDVPDTPEGRIERWQRKLLDLSLRNRLLNYRDTKQALPFVCPDVPALEDVLSAGKAFRAFALRDDDPTARRALSPEERTKVEESVARDVFEKRQLAVPLTKKETNERLLNLYRRSRSDMAEGGTNTLFLAVGFMRWKKAPSDTRYYRAPLLLIPMQLARRSAKSDFRMLHHEDDIRFNATLLELLKRDFDLRIPELEGELPRDDSGIDVPKIFAILRHHVRDAPGFEVTEDSALSTFSFAKYLMWKDLVDRNAALRQAPLVQHLVDNPGGIFHGSTAVIPVSELDLRLRPKDLYTPMAADSSQLAAVMAASDGQNFVLIGPPGTGKSQTITNIIAQCVALGKSVLFVAEKAAALDVVHRRLTHSGLGDLCLELHSNKTDRKSVLAQLGRAWDRDKPTDTVAWTRVTDDLELSRDQLNAYVQALHHKGRQGFSVFDAIGHISQGPAKVSLRFANKDAHTPLTYQRLIDCAADLQLTFDAVCSGPALTVINASDWSFSWQSEVLDCAASLRMTLKDLRRSSSSLSARLGLTSDTAVQATRLRRLAAVLTRLSPTAGDLSVLPDMPFVKLRANLVDLDQGLVAQANANQRLTAQYDGSAISRIPLETLDTDWRAAQAQFWPFSKIQSGKVQKMLQSYASSGTADPSVDLAALFALRDAQAKLAGNALAPLATSRSQIDGLETLLDQAETLQSALADLKPQVEVPQTFGQAKAALSAGPVGDFKQDLQAFETDLTRYENAKAAFDDVSGGTDDALSLQDLDDALGLVISQSARLSDWTRWIQARDAAVAQDIGPLVQALEEGRLDLPADQELIRAYATWWLPLAMDDQEVLQQFRHWEHEHILTTFRALVDRAAEQAPNEVKRLAAHDLPSRDGVARKSELGVLRHQLGLQRPSMAIRTLLSNLPDQLAKLTPCVLMSPLSVAQYLPPGQAGFDVVIFDEASQITTWDAIGAIARGGQAIIVGDPKQLPPTNFFGRTEDEDDALAELDRDLPSILDEVSAAGIPTRRLDWHYRSRDEALIAFSNHHYYGGKLVTFPAPHARGDALHFHNVNGIYARGKGRTNTAEAQAIAAFVQTRLTDWLALPDESRQTLGVITFNAQQQALIQDQLDAMRRAKPELEWFFDDAREEPVIVKNLENIQGDERDVMLFSITFGPDEAGKTTMNFGALNGDGGEKRLNVAVTRARRELHVFASLGSDEIDLSRTRARGVAHLKAFLDYVDRGPVALPEDQDPRSRPQTRFEGAVAQALQRRGWDLDHGVGVSGVRLDLAVRHPDHPDTFLAGIECDGAQYNAAATARDRDKVRHEVLMGLGWQLLRVWSRDWVLDQAGIVSRLDAALSQMLDADRTRRVKEAEAHASDADPVTNDGQRLLPSPDVIDQGPADPQPLATEAEEHEQPTEPQVAKSATPTRGAADRFYDMDYTPELRRMVFDLIVQNSPLPMSRLSRLVAQAHGWSRAGSQIAGRVERLVDDTRLEPQFGVPFVWDDDGPCTRTPFRGLEDRALRDVSRSEIAQVMDDNADDISAAKDAAQAVARLLGIKRLSKDARSYLDQIHQWRASQAKDT